MAPSAQQSGSSEIKKVMISSTALDLPEHRKVVLDACLRQGMYPVMMEHMAAVNAVAIEESLRLVDDADIYLGIFAYRYDYVPIGYNISITEMEYNRAVERGIPRLIFLMDKDHPVEPTDVETGEGAVKVEELKERLMTEHVVNFFKSPAELQVEVLDSLSKLRQLNLPDLPYVSNIPNFTPEEYQRAIEQFDRELELDSQQAWIYTKRGEAYRLIQEYGRAKDDLDRAIELDSDLARAYASRGIVYFSLLEYERAIADINRALELDPSLTRVYISRGKIYASLQQYQRAIEDYNRTIEFDQQFVDAYNGRGNAYANLKQYEQALADYDRAIELDPNNIEAYNGRGNTYADLQQYVQALADFDHTIYLDPTTVTAYINKGNVLRYLERYDEALDAYEHAILLDPNFVPAYINEGWALYNLERFQEAIAAFEHAIELDSYNANAHAGKGIIFYYLKRYEEAIIAYSQAIELEPSYAYIYQERGRAYASLKEYEHALADYNRALELDPTYIDAYNGRGNAYADLKEYQRAIEDFSLALELDPKNANAYNNRGNAYADLKQYERAIEDFSLTLELDPTYVDAYYNRGFVYYSVGDYQRAIEDYSHAIELDPKDTDAHYSRGVVYDNLKEHQRAIEDYSRAIELDSTYARAYYNRGNVYHDLEEYQHAIEDYTRAIQLEPNVAETYYNRGIAYADLLKYNRAIEDYNRALNLDPQLAQTSPEVLSAIVATLQNAAEGATNLQAASDVSSASHDLLAEGARDATRGYDALKATSRAARSSTKVLSALIAALHNADTNVRSMVVQSLGPLASASPEVLSALLSALQRDRDPNVRSSAAQSLGPLAQASPEVLSALIAALRDSDSDVRSSAAQSLGLLGQTSSEVVQSLLQSQQWEQAEQFIATIENSYEQEAALLALGTALTQAQLWEEAERVITSIRDSYSYAEALLALGSALAQAQLWEQVQTVWGEAERVGQTIKDSETRAEFLRKLSHHRAEESTAQHLQELSIRYDILLAAPVELVPIGGHFEVAVYLDVAGSSDDSDSSKYLLVIPRNEVVGSELSLFLIAPPGFKFEGENVASLPLDLYIGEESTTVQSMPHVTRFNLIALRPGTSKIAVELYRGSTFETTLETEVQVAKIDEYEQPKVNPATRPRPVLQPDLILQVQMDWKENDDAYALRYTLSSLRASLLIAHTDDFSSELLPTGWIDRIRGLLGSLLEDMNGSQPEDMRSRLISLGQYLFQFLFPFELQHEIRNLAFFGNMFTLLILADQDSWIPWELLHDGQAFLGERFIIGRWPRELDDTRPFEFPVGMVNIAYYASIKQPEQWLDLLKLPGVPHPQLLPGGVFSSIDTVEEMRGLYLVRSGQAKGGSSQYDAPVQLSGTSGNGEVEHEVRSSKLSLRRNRPLVNLGYVSAGQSELTMLEQVWAPTFVRAGCSAFVGPLWAVQPAVEEAFVSTFYSQLWTGHSLGEAFRIGRILARAAAPDSLDWLAYVLFGDPMARPYRPVEGQGYAVIEPIGREIDDPLPSGVPARFRVSLRRVPPVWHEERVIEMANTLTFNNLQVHVMTFGMQLTPTSPIDMMRTPTDDYLGWFSLIAPPEMAGDEELVQVYFVDGKKTIHTLSFSLKIASSGGGSR